MEATSADGASTHRRRRTALLLLAVGLVVLLIYLVGSTRRAGRSAGASGSDDVPGSGDGDGTAAGAALAQEQRTDQVSPEPPIIDEIKVEKPEVCEGEENLVTVKAHDPGGNDAGLRSLVNGLPGWSVPVRARENLEDPDAPPRTVLVVGNDGSSAVVPIPAYKIKDCKPAAQLRMRALLLPNSTAEYRVEARVVKGVSPGRPRPARFIDEDFVPTRYFWEFGDGATATTTEPYVEHSYEFRAQSTYFSYYLLRVTASDDNGRQMVARHSLEIMNPAYEELAQKQLVKIMTHNTPRFPELVDGRVQQRVRLWHFHRAAISIDRVTAFIHDTTGKELGRAQVDPAGLLGSRSIPAGAGLDIPAVLDVAGQPGVGFITYDLEGTTADGQRARGAFSIMRPPEPPTRERNIPVNDPMMAAKIKAAMEILGKQYVTDEDIWALERQGKFKGLKPIKVTPGPDGPPSWLPRPPRSDGEPWSPDDDPGSGPPPDDPPPESR